MLRDKRQDLDGEKQKVLLIRVLNDVSHSHPDLYYQSTSEIARLIRLRVEQSTGLTTEEHALLAPLSQRDVEVLLSLM